MKQKKPLPLLPLLLPARNLLLLLVTLGIRTNSQVYFELALLMGLLGFVGTVALAKFLMRGEVIE